METRPYLVGIEQDLSAVSRPPKMATANLSWPATPIDFTQQTLTATGWSGAFMSPPGEPLVLTWQCVEENTPQWDLGIAAAGGYDAIWLKQLLHILKLNVLGFRIMQEGNGTWFQWSRNIQPEIGSYGTEPGDIWPVDTYVQAFRRAATVARSVFPSAWIDWCLSVPECGGPVTTLAEAYPGDDVVDVISFDAYQTKWTPTWEAVLAAPMFNPPSIANFAAARGKHVGIGEFATGGCLGIPGSVTFFRDVVAWCEKQGPALRYASYYDAGGWDCLWSNARPDLRAAWNTSAFGAKEFSHTMPPV